MSTVPAMQSALNGIDRSLRQIDAAAGRIARPAPVDDLARDLVELTIGQRSFEANVVTLRVADELVGSLLDVLA